MSYDNPFARERYYFPSAAFGATTDSMAIRGPLGKTGLVKDIIQYITADMVGTTTVPEINVGSAASVIGTLKNEYARFRLGTTLILGYTSAAGPRRARSLAMGAAGYAGGAVPTWTDFAAHVLLETARIPADTVIYISRVLGVGGSPAGTGATVVEIDWD